MHANSDLKQVLSIMIFKWKYSKVTKRPKPFNYYLLHDTENYTIYKLNNKTTFIKITTNKDARKMDKLSEISNPNSSWKPRFKNKQITM